MSKYYERPAAVNEAANNRAGLARRWYNQSVGAGEGGGAGVTINAKTDVHVRSTDPKEAGKEVAARQDEVNANTVRYAGDQVVR